MNPTAVISRLACRIGLTCLAVVICLTAATAGATPAPATPASQDFVAIDAYVEAQMRELRIPGLALGITHGDQVVHLQGFGRADPTGRVVTPQTSFMIGSLTKPITALAMMQLVEQGKLDLDAPVQRYLPWFRVADADASARITVRHLMSHTSGLAEDADAWLETTSDTSNLTLEQVVRALNTAKIHHQLGTTWDYSNAGFVTLGLLIETLSAQRYADYVQQHIFTPLHMDHAYTSLAAAQQHGVAIGHQAWFGFPVPAAGPTLQGAALPAGGLAASAEDMTHFMIAELSGGRYNDTAVLSPAGIAAMHQPLAPMGRGKFVTMGWWADRTPDGHVTALSHDGETGHYHPMMLLVPDGNWGIIILTNMSGQGVAADVDPLAFGVAALLKGEQLPSAHLSTTKIFFRLPIALLVLQLVGIGWSLVKLRRLRQQPDRQPHGWRRTLAIGGPLIRDLTLALIFLVGFPLLLGSLRFNLIWFPEIGYTLVVGGALALGWGMLRTALAFWALRRPGPLHRAGAPVNA
jgi:CubicO group peptidase (beta-lactamase class C family)